jgi:hypothetical protein
VESAVESAIKKKIEVKDIKKPAIKIENHTGGK